MGFIPTLLALDGFPAVSRRRSTSSQLKHNLDKPPKRVREASPTSICTTSSSMESQAELDVDKLQRNIKVGTWVASIVKLRKGENRRFYIGKVSRHSKHTFISVSYTISLAPITRIKQIAL